MKLLSIISFGIVLMICLMFAALYLFRGRFMPYHSDAVERKWEELEESMQVLLLALMRVVGGGWLATAVASVIFLYLYIWREMAMAPLFLALSSLAVAVPSLLATLKVRSNTMANPPVWAAALSILLLVLGGILGMLA